MMTEPLAVCLLLGISLIIVGIRLNSYGIDSAGVAVAMLGWLMSAVGAALVGWFALVLFGHWVEQRHLVIVPGGVCPSIEMPVVNEIVITGGQVDK